MDTEYPKYPPLQVGIRGRCPRCAQGHLFDGFLTLTKRCEVCDLDYGFADPADGPAFFVMCFGCVPSALLAVWLEVAYSAPVWLNLLLSIPFMLLTCILPLRPLKGWFVASQYYFKAEQGKVARVTLSESAE